MVEKKRILVGYIGDGHAGGLDRYILNLIDSVDCEQYRIDLLTTHINLELCRELEKVNIGLLEIPGLKAPVRQYKKLIQIMKNGRYDAVYINISTAINIMGLVAAKRVGINNRIVHSHSSGIDNEKQYKRMILTGIHNIGKLIIAGTANVFIGCSQKAGEWMYTKKILQSKAFFVVHNSVSLKRYKFDSETRASMRKKMSWDGKKIILHVANFTYPKNHEFILEVFKKVHDKDEKCILVLVGEGYKEAKIRELAERYGIKDCVYFTGLVSNVKEYLDASDIFVLPSKFEGYPISALEAQVNGMQCLLSDKVTDEAQISKSCRMLPLDADEWAASIMKAEISDARTVMENIEEFDNNILSRSIEKIWSRECT